MNGLVITAATVFGQYEFPVASISKDLEQSSVGPLSELIVNDAGNDVYAFEGRDQSGCYGIISAELQ